jgi:hypothetical protein
VVSFTSWVLQFSGKGPWHPMAKQAGQTGKEKILPLLRINPIIQPHTTVSVLTVILVADKEESSKILVQSNL